jgi:type I restriction enzyme M protein
MIDEKMNVSEQVSMILDIANLLRGPFKEEEYEKVIIPMTICRRFECILSKTKAAVLEAYKKGVTNEIKLKYKSGLPIYNTSKFTLEKLLDDPGKIKENFKAYLNSFNPLGVSIFTQLDFFKTMDKLAEKKKLYIVIKKFAKTDLTIEHVSSMKMGYIMEEIIRKYSENASAGDHFTPREVIKCLTRLLFAEGCDDLKQPGKIITLGDFACGTGGMLYEGYDMIKKINKSAEVELFGQDNNDWYAAIALAETIIRGQNPENIKLVDSTLVTDAHENQKMRFILMNPPFGQSWAKDKIGDEQYNKIVEHSTKPSGWYTAGLPQTGDMQLLFWQFALNKLQENGRAAIICNGSPLFSDKANESEIRKWLFEKDYIEAIIQFCPELFYNTGISIYAFIFNKKKSEERKNKIQLINASSFAKRLTKGLGFKRNELTGDHITEIVDLYSKFENNENCKILEKEDFYYKEVPSYQPFQRIFSISEEKILTLYGVQSFKKLYTDEAYYELDEITSKTQAQLDKMDSLLQGKELQEKIIKILRENISATVYKNREDFTNKVIELLPEIRTNKSLVKGIVLAMSEDSDEGMRYYDKKGRVEADPELKDIETIPYKQLISEYYEQEVKPFVDDAWLEEDQNKIRTSCIINFNKFFYKSIEPEASSSILERIKSLSEIESNLENDLYD